MHKTSVLFSVFVAYSLSGMNPQGAQPLLAQPLDNNKAVVELLIKAAKECSIAPTLQPGVLHDTCSQEAPNNLLMLADLCAPIEAQGPQTGNNAVPSNAINNNDVDLPNDEEQSPLFLAAQEKTVGSLRALLNNNNASLNYKDTEGNTALHVATETGNLTIVKEILGQNFNLKHLPNNNGVCPLHLAAGAPNRHAEKIVELFLPSNVNIQDADGDTPLHYAVRENGYKTRDSLFQTTKTLELLLDAGAGVNAQNNRGQSPLFCTVYNRYGSNRAQFLIEHGADLSLRQNDGKTALEFVKHHERSKPALIKFLKKATQELADKEAASRRRHLYRTHGTDESEKKARTA
jgi:ankyrin repeat protein